MPDAQEDEATDPQLKQQLGRYQIFFIAVTVVIGSGVFIDYGSAAKTAGPGGMLVAFFIVSTLAIAAMDGLSEMIQLFPTVNPIVELVHEFIDPELARLTGFAYWFAYCAFLVVQLCRAAAYLDFYISPADPGSEFGKVVTFYILFPLIIVLLNIAPVKVFGYIESASGLLKLLILLAVISMCLYIAGESKVDAPFEHPFRSQLAGSSLAAGSALCLSIEFIAFSFCGIETVALTTFEAKDATSLRISSQILAWVVSVVYFLSAISQILLLPWETSTHNADCVPTLDESYHNSTCTTGSVIIIQAAKLNPSLGMAKALNAMFIFCVFSAANSCLYVSSRMLYGIAYINSQKRSAWMNTRKFWKLIGHVTPSGVPIYAIFTSATIFIWVPFTQIAESKDAHRLISWFANAGSLCVIFVWGTINLAFIRYYYWFKGHRTSEGVLSQSRFLRLNRWKRREKGCSTLLARAQPYVSIYAVLGSYIIVFVLASADLWRPPSEIHANIFFQYFTIPILLPLLWVLMKVYVLIKLAVEHKRANDTIVDAMKRGWDHLSWYRHFGQDARTIKDSITNLTLHLKPDQKVHVQRLQDGQELEPLNQGFSDS